MKKLIADPESFYTPKKRPSGHDIGSSFGIDNGGSLPSNLLSIPNTESNGQYMASCKLVNASSHPARFPAKLPAFFVDMLTDQNDLVIDIFAGSNTTGQVAEASRRRWMAFELDPKYVAASALRFLPSSLPDETIIEAYQRILAGETVDLGSYSPAPTLFEVSA
jgi:site-specific DNA-methyltransferase (cytosine-N4-specific)